MKNQAMKLHSVSVIAPMTLQVNYDKNRSLDVSFESLTNQLTIFAPLKDEREFATAEVTDFGWTLEWSCGASLDSDRVLEMALEQKGMINNIHFRHWQDSHGLSLSKAADALGLSRRTVSQYRTGIHHVPKTVYLACKGWEYEQQHSAINIAKINTPNTLSVL
jgi:hypothetical protein